MGSGKLARVSPSEGHMVFIGRKKAHTRNDRGSSNVFAGKKPIQTRECRHRKRRKGKNKGKKKWIYYQYPKNTNNYYIG